MILALLIAALAFQPTPAEQVAIDALSAHHAPPCSELRALSADSLARIAEADLQPSWAGMRAARCLLQRGLDVQDHVRPWLADPARPGLASLALRHLHRLPEHAALALADAGLAGPHAIQARRLLAASPAPVLRARAKPPAAP